MKKNSWKTLLSVLLLLAMLVSMLPFAAFAEDDQTANTQTEEAANTDEVDVPKVEEKTGDTPKADGKTDATKTDEKSGDTVKDESKDVPKDDAAKDGSKDAPKDDAAKDENKDTPIGDTEQPAKGSSEDAAPKTVDITLTYDANGGTGSCSETKTFNVGEEYTFTVKPRFDTGIDRAKHAFLYWTIDKDGERDRYNGNNQITVTGDTTLYAQWQYVPQKINILYSPNYSSIEPVVSESATEGESYPVLGSNTFRPPYNKHFVNWNTASDGSGTPYEADSVITAPGNDLTLYAQWEDDPKWSELDISVTAAPENPTLGETITYTVTVTNNTGLTLSGITINNGMNSYNSISMLSLQSSLSDGWDLTSTSEGNLCNYSKDLAPGASSSYDLTTSFINADNKTATCTATITSLSAGGSTVSGRFGSASAAAALKELDWSKLKIEKTVDKTSARPGDTLTYTIKITNNTGYDLTVLRVEDPVPANTSNPEASQSSGRWFLSIPTDNSRVVAELQGGLAKGASETFFMEVTVDRDAPSGKVESTAKITSAKSGSDYTLTDTHPGGIVSNTVTTDVLPALELSMSVSPAMPTIYQTFTYTVTVKNNSNINMKAVYIHDVLPKDVSIGGRQVFGGGAGSMVKSDDIRKPTVLDVTITELAAGGEAYYIVNAYFTSNIPTAENVASITKFITEDNKTVTEGLDTAKATAYSLLGLSIKKSVDKDTAKPGDTLIYTVEVNNGTITDLTKLSVDDILPAGVTYDPDNSVPGDWTFDTATTPGTVKASLSTDLISGGKAVFKIAATVNAGVSGTITNEAKITEAESKYGSMSSSTNKYDTARTEVLPAVPVNVTVLFAGLKDVSQVPAGYKLTGADGNPFLKGEIKLDPAESKTGHVFRKFSTEEYVRLGQEYSLSFTQSDYDIPGYICTLTTETDPIKVTAQDAIAGINAEITLSYVKENLYTYPSLTVRTYFKGLAKLPDNFGYKLNCVSAPEDAIAFQGPLALTPGTENGVPYLEFSAKNVTLQAGTELTFSFTQSGYDVPGYLCALGSSTFKFTLPVPTTDVRQPILLKIDNTYTQPDWSKLTITKTADKTSATPGSVVNYTVTVTNNTGVDLSDIIVADKLDSRLRYSSSTGDYDTGTGTWTVASLANGKSVTLTLTVKLKYALAAGTVIENTASVTEAAAAGLIYDLSGQKLYDSVSVTVTSGKGSPRTGDESNLGLWIAVMAASLACAGAAAVIYKKRRG